MYFAKTWRYDMWYRIFNTLRITLNKKAMMYFSLYEALYKNFTLF